VRQISLFFQSEVAVLLESSEVTLTKLLFDIVESRFVGEQGVTGQHTSRHCHLWTPLESKRFFDLRQGGVAVIDPHVAGILTMDQNTTENFCKANAAHYRDRGHLRRDDQAAGCGFLNILNASYGFDNHFSFLELKAN
jgi:hypothetical protein